VAWESSGCLRRGESRCSRPTSARRCRRPATVQRVRPGEVSERGQDKPVRGQCAPLSAAKAKDYDGALTKRGFEEIGNGGQQPGEVPELDEDTGSAVRNATVNVKSVGVTIAGVAGCHDVGPFVGNSCKVQAASAG